MKARLLYIFLLISFTASAQVDTVLSQFNATINLYAASGSGPTFTIQGIINNTTGQYTASDVAIGDIIFASEADRCVRLRVDNVTVVGQAISATVTDLEGVVTNVPLGIAMIARETANNSFPLFVDGVSADLLACVRTHFTLLVDNIEGEQGPPGADTDSIYYTLNDSTYLATKGDTIPLPTLLDTAYAIADTLYFISGTDTTEVLITDTDTDQQNLSLVGDSLLIERGTGVDLSVYRDTFTDTNTDTDSIYFDNRSTIQLITRGDTIALPQDLVYDGDSSITNELQDIDSVVLSGNLLTVYISNGASASVDLSGYSPTDRADTSGYNLTFYILNDSLNLTDGIGNLKVDLSPYLDNTDTDSIVVDSLGTLLVKNRGDVITLIPDTDTDTDEQNLSLVGDSLLIERGTGVDLSGYLDNTDTSGYNQSLTFANGQLTITDGNNSLIVTIPDSVGGFPLPTDSITFNNNEAGPNEAELNWDSTLGYLVFGGIGDQLIQIGQDQYWMTINQSGGPILKGEVVRAAGAIGNSGKFLIQKYLADGNTDPNYLLGVAAHDIPDGTEGYVMHQGKIRQIDLTAYNTGQVLYVSPTVAGDWVTTEPSNGYQKLPIAFVVDSSANGTLAVRVKTGEALRDLHDVDVSSPSDGDLISYDSVLGYWVTKADSVIDDDSNPTNEIQTISVSQSSDSITIGLSDSDTISIESKNGIYTSSNNSQDAAVTAIGVPTSLNYDANTLVIEGSNNRVGIGTASPSEVLDVVGDVEIDGKLDLNDGGGSVFVGTNAGLNDDASDNRNVGVGQSALRYNTTGNSNTATGYEALFNNTTGFRHTATGYRALFSNTTANYNTATGYAALYNNTTGSQNTATGYLALTNNTTANFNTANGHATLRDNTTGAYNTAIGYQALVLNTTGTQNTATGVQALVLNTTGTQNTATGVQALNSNTTGYSNTATGYLALYNNTTGYNNIAYGYQAGRLTSTDDDNTLPTNSIFIGYDARPNADIQTNQIVIGYQGRGEGSNTIKIGNSSHTGAYIEGIKGQTTTHGANVHITADGRLMESTTSVTVFDTLYSVGDSIIFITPTPDTFIVTFQTQTDDWGTQVVQSDATLDGTGVTGNLLTLAQQSATNGQVLKWDNTAGTWLPANDIDTDTNTDEQDIDGLTFNTGTGDLTVGITNGTSQTIDLDGRYLEAEVDGDVTNEIQVLSKSNDTIYLSNGGGFVLDTDTDTYLTSDSVKLYASEMVTGNTETLINVTYDAVTQTFDFVVDNDLSNYDNSTSNFLTSEVDGSTTNELQNLSLVGDSIKITNGTGVYINGFYDNTDTSGYNSALSLVNDTIYLTDGNGTLGVYVPGDDWGDDVVQTDATLTGNGTAGSPLSVVFPADQVYDGDSSVTNEIQNLSIDSSGRVFTLSIENGNSVSFEDQVDDADSDSTNEIQTISIDSSGRLFTISLTNGDSVRFEDKFEANTDTDSIYFRHFNIVSNITRGDTAVVEYVVSDYPNGYVHCDTNDITKIKSVTSTTGRIWMDRNLGASRVATSSTDTLAYGDLFQWGRFAEGHQCRDSDTTSTNATTATPSLGNTWDGKFILEPNSPDDWLTPQDDNLWQGVNGVNNPCPSGYRLPTETELNTERLTWSNNNNAGAFSSPLKLPVSGFRLSSSGDLFNVGSYGGYWSSSVSGSNAHYLFFFSTNANSGYNYRANGFSVRCIKDENTTQYILDESNSNKLIAISEDNKFEWVDASTIGSIGTDDQTITDFTLGGDDLVLSITIEDGNTDTVDLSSLKDGNGLWDSQNEGQTIAVRDVGVFDSLKFDTSTLVIDAVANQIGINTLSPSFDLDVNGKIGLGSNQAMYFPFVDDTDFAGSVVVGNGGQNLSNTSGAEGAGNTFVGWDAGKDNSTGYRNTFVGNEAGMSNTVGDRNTAIGYQSGRSLIGGIQNTLLGFRSGYSLTSGQYNTMFGVSSGNDLTTGIGNQFIGHESGRYLTDDNYNTFLGYRAGLNLISGNNNIFLGSFAGSETVGGNVTSAENSIAIGYQAKFESDTTSNEIVIGHNQTGAGTNSMTLGSPFTSKTIIRGITNNTTGFSANIYIDPTNSTLKRLSSSLRYKENIRDYNRSISELMQMRPVLFKAKGDESGRDFAGFIAEEIDELGMTEFVDYDEEGKPDALNYANMTALLVKTIQDQQKQIEALTKRIEQLENK